MKLTKTSGLLTAAMVLSASANTNVIAQQLPATEGVVRITDGRSRTAPRPLTPPRIQQVSNYQTPPTPIAQAPESNGAATPPAAAASPAAPGAVAVGDCQYGNCQDGYGYGYGNGCYGQCGYGTGCFTEHYCKHSPDYGYSPPAKYPLHRQGVEYTNYYPARWYGAGGENITSQAPMVYQPTDTTQLGFYYQHVPTWVPQPNRIPARPVPAQWHITAPAVSGSGFCNGANGYCGAPGGGCPWGGCNYGPWGNCFNGSCGYQKSLFGSHGVLTRGGDDCFDNGYNCNDYGYDNSGYESRRQIRRARRAARFNGDGWDSYGDDGYGGRQRSIFRTRRSRYCAADASYAECWSGCCDSQCVPQNPSSNGAAQSETVRTYNTPAATPAVNPVPKTMPNPIAPPPPGPSAAYPRQFEASPASMIPPVPGATIQPVPYRAPASAPPVSMPRVTSASAQQPMQATTANDLQWTGYRDLR